MMFAPLIATPSTVREMVVKPPLSILTRRVHDGRRDAAARRHVVEQNALQLLLGEGRVDVLGGEPELGEGRVGRRADSELQ